jgi:hypothetical protein
MNYCGGGRLFNDREALNALVGMSFSTTPYLTEAESLHVLTLLLPAECTKRLGEDGRLVRELIERTIRRDGEGMRVLGDRLLAQFPKDVDRRLLRFAVDAAMLGAVVSGDPAHAQMLWQRHGKRVQTGRSIPSENRLMLSIAEVRLKQR